jgi:tetratricopeptide (TPR) repeat protein
MLHRLLHRLSFFCFLIFAGCTTFNTTKPEIVDHSRQQQSEGQAPTPSPTVAETPTPLPVDMPAKQVALPQTQATASPVVIPSAALSLIKQAEIKEQEGDLAMAGAALERALRIAPNSAEIYYRLARVREAQGQHDQAVQFARRGLAQGADSELQAKLQALIAGN